VLAAWCVRGANTRCASGEEFPAFPFPPYGIQKDLMRHIYATLDAGGVGVFESPTGTVRRGECLFARKRPGRARDANSAPACLAGQDAQPAVRRADVAERRASRGCRAKTASARRRRRCVRRHPGAPMRTAPRRSCCAYHAASICARIVCYLCAPDALLRTQSRTGFATTAATRRAPRPSAPPRSARSAASACAKPPAGPTPWAHSWCVASLPPCLRRLLSAPADRIAPLSRCPRRPGRALRRRRPS
jgi:hypothetical protein